MNMLLLNKADLLTREQRYAWAKHFQKEGIRAVFWSALAEAQRLDAEEKVRPIYSEGKTSIWTHFFLLFNILPVHISTYLHTSFDFE